MLAIAVARRLTQHTVDNVLGPSVMFIDLRHSEEPLKNVHANTTVTQQIKRRDRYQSRSSGWVHEWRGRSGGPQD